MCGAECESVVHVLWSVQPIVILEASLWKGSGAFRYADFDKLNSIEKTAYVLGSGKMTLTILKEYVVGVWNVRKQKFYGDDSCPSQLQSLVRIYSWLGK